MKDFFKKNAFSFLEEYTQKDFLKRSVTRSTEELLRRRKNLKPVADPGWFVLGAFCQLRT